MIPAATQRVLDTLCMYTWHLILGTNKIAHDFMVDVGLIPSRNTEFPCPTCGRHMYVADRTNLKLGWRWQCYNFNCSKQINPANNTFIENSKLPLRDILAIIVGFIHKIPVNQLYDHLCNWRKSDGLRTMSKESVIDYMFFCREVCSVVVANDTNLYGGPGKTLDLNETFFIKRKYSKGELIESHTITIFGIWCLDDKDGLFTVVQGYSKATVWPLISKYCHPQTSRICTGSGEWYVGIKQLFKNAIHYTNNKSKGEFVAKNRTTIKRNLGNEKKWLKATIQSGKNMHQLQKYIDYHYRFRHYFRQTQTIEFGKRLLMFIEDIKRVCPGPGKEGFSLGERILPTPESEGIVHLMPKDYQPGTPGYIPKNPTILDDRDDDFSDLDDKTLEDLVYTPSPSVRRQRSLQPGPSKKARRK